MVYFLLKSGLKNAIIIEIIQKHSAKIPLIEELQML